jgi:3-hydroxyacyl-[acyl-carrier-protein] dehydratase
MLLERAIMSSPSSAVQALSDLPHGPEFRFVDEVLELDPGVSARGVYTLREDAHFLRGHFPGHPIMPGVLMAEAMAQLGGILVQTRPGIPALADLRLTAILNLKILGSTGPEQRLFINAKLDNVLGTLAHITAEVCLSDGTALARGKLLLSGTEALPAAG